MSCVFSRNLLIVFAVNQCVWHAMYHVVLASFFNAHAINFVKIYQLVLL